MWGSSEGCVGWCGVVWCGERVWCGVVWCGDVMRCGEGWREV